MINSLCKLIDHRHFYFQASFFLELKGAAMLVQCLNPALSTVATVCCKPSASRPVLVPQKRSSDLTGSWWDERHLPAQLTGFVISTLVMIPTARMKSIPARARPLRSTRALWDSRFSAVLTAAPSTTSDSSCVPVFPSQDPGSSCWVSGDIIRKNVKLTGSYECSVL